MFQELECSIETLNLFDWKEPQFHHAVRFEMEKRLPHVKFRVFSFSVKENFYFYGYKKNSLSRDSIILYNKGSFVAEQFLEGFDHFQEEVELFEPKRNLIFLAEVKFTNEVTNYIQKHGIPVNVGGNKSFFFIVSPKQENLLMDMPLPKLPAGYVYGNADPNDAELITDYWMYAPEGEAPNTREKLKAFPSSCIRFEGKPVAFEMIDISGALNHQYVMKEHRGKGLGAAVEIDLAKKCIREGIFVEKNVDVVKKSVIEASRRSEYWTTVKNSEGSDCIKEYLYLTPK